MRKLIYIEENFITPDECQELIDLSPVDKDEGKDFRTNVTISDPNANLTEGIEWRNHGAVYHGDVYPTVPSLDYDVITRVNSICKSFDSTANLDYVGVVRWPVGTFMKPHVDDNDVHKQDLFAAMLYLNNNFSGGYTCFEDFEVKPEIGKLIVFSNSQYLHYVSEVRDAERFVLSFWYNSLNK